MAADTAPAEGAPAAGPPHPLRVRTVTLFLCLPADEAAWARELRAAGALLARAAAAYGAAGYEVQTTRIATQPANRFLGPPGPSLAPAAARLEALAHECGIPMLSLGGIDDPAYLPWLPPLLAATKTVSCSFALPPSEPPCGALARRAAAAALQIAHLTGGARNFGFGAAINCGGAGIPYFPVASATADCHRAFAVGLEADTVLYNAFAAAAAAHSGSGGSGGSGSSGGRRRPVPLAAAGEALAAGLLAALAPIEAIALRLESPPDQITPDQISYRYLGLDSSVAPGLDTPPLTAAFERLGLGAFGGPGTLAACGLVTRTLKSLPLRLTGYCGLMLAVCEDAGLAAAAAAGALSLHQLLQWSAVCGCGLDTVPVPGPRRGWGRLYASVEPGAPVASSGGGGEAGGGGGSIAAGGGAAGGSGGSAAGGGGGESEDADAAENEEILEAFTGVILDTALLSARLRKPLAVRLLPLPGAAAGDATAFENPYLIDSKVMPLA